MFVVATEEIERDSTEEFMLLDRAISESPLKVEGQRRGKCLGH